MSGYPPRGGTLALKFFVSMIYRSLSSQNLLSKGLTDKIVQLNGLRGHLVWSKKCLPVFDQDLFAPHFYFSCLSETSPPICDTKITASLLGFRGGRAFWGVDNSLGEWG